MNGANPDGFCPVCQHAWRVKVLSLTSPVKDSFPAENIVLAGDNHTFGANLVSATLAVAWTINGVTIDAWQNRTSVTEAEVSAEANLLGFSGEKLIKLTLTDPTSLVYNPYRRSLELQLPGEIQAVESRLANPALPDWYWQGVTSREYLDQYNQGLIDSFNWSDFYLVDELENRIQVRDYIKDLLAHHKQFAPPESLLTSELSWILLDPNDRPDITLTPTMLPTSTPQPTATITPSPTAIPIPTMTPEPTVTPTPYPTITPMPTATPVLPTATMQPTPTATPLPQPISVVLSIDDSGQAVVEWEFPLETNIPASWAIHLYINDEFFIDSYPQTNALEKEGHRFTFTLSISEEGRFQAFVGAYYGEYLSPWTASPKIDWQPDTVIEGWKIF